MSRWVDDFNNHAFRKDWEAICAAIDKAEVDDSTVVTSVTELARFKKVVKYIDELLKSVDPELIPRSTWDNFHSQGNACLQQVNNFNNNKQIAHITQANEHVDNLLTYIRPYMVAPSEAVSALQSAVSEYVQVVENYTADSRVKAKSLLDDLNVTKIKVDEMYSQVEARKAEIDEFSHETFGDDGISGLKGRLNEFLKQVENEHRLVHEYYEKLLVGFGGENPISNEVRDAVKSVKGNFSESKEILASLVSLKSDLNSFYNKVFGEKEGGSKSTVGLKGEIQQRIDQLDSFKGEQKLKYSALIEEIEGLLPGATSAGLATAYQEMKESYDNPIVNSTRMFYGSLALIVIVSLVTSVESLTLDGIIFVKFDKPFEFFNSLLYKLPVFVPSFWLALHASKRRSQMQRLQQEYAHKEALAKSYNSFKKQIMDLGEQDGALQKKLIERAVDAVSDNASKTLDGRHGDGMPSMTVIEKLADMVTKRISGGR